MTGVEADAGPAGAAAMAGGPQRLGLRRAAWRYLAAALMLGIVADWASETFFWSAPRGPVLLAERLLTIVAYAASAGAALSAVLLTGVGGLRALFLGGAVLGFLIEGVVVGTMYQAFPAQLVWTPLAWHALVSGVVVLGFGRLAGRLPLWAAVAGWLAIGAFGGTWAQFWPTERDLMPGLPATLGYLAGLGLLVPLAQVGLDRLTPLHLPRRWVLMVLPALAVLVWLAGFAFVPTPLRLAGPVMIGLTVLAMRGLGAGPRPLDLGPPAPAARHALFLIAPVTAALMAVPGWQRFDGLEVNIPVALGTGGLSLLWWLSLLWRGLRRPRIRLPAG